MDVSNLSLDEISLKLEHYIIEYLNIPQTTSFCQPMFLECFLFELEEIEHLVPKEYEHLFKATDKWSGASGSLQLKSNSYNVMLLLNEDCTKAFWLYLQDNRNEEIFLVKDFCNRKSYV